MKRIEAWVVDIFACHMLLVNPRLNDDDKENTIMISAGITFMLPLIVVLASVVAVLSFSLTMESMKPAVVVAVLVIVFGVSSVTDRIYHRNFTEIRARADAILQNPELGAKSVRWRLLKIYLANAAALAIIIVLISFFS